MSTNQVIRVRKETGFTILDNGIFKDTLLSMKAKGLLATLLSLPEDWNFSTIGLAKLCNDGETAVRSALKELEQNGYLNREAIREKGTIIDWKYTIYEERQPKDFTKKPDVSSPDVENNHVVNPPQLNTKESSTKEENNTSTKVEVEPPKGDSVNDTEVHGMVLENNTEGVRTNIYNRAPQKILTKEKSKKPNLWDKCFSEIHRRYKGTKVYDPIIEYLGYRIKSDMHPLGYSGWVGLLNKLDKLGQTDDEKCKIIEQSIKMKWDTFAELKQWNNRNSKYSGTDVFAEGGFVKSVPADRNNFMKGVKF